MIADIFKGWKMDGVGENYCKLVVRLGYTLDMGPSPSYCGSHVAMSNLATSKICLKDVYKIADKQCHQAIFVIFLAITSPLIFRCDKHLYS